MGGITRETAALHGHIASTVAQQLDGLSARFEAATQTVADTWTSALARHEHSSESAGAAPGQHARRLRPELRAALGRVGGCGGRRPCGMERAESPVRRRPSSSGVSAAPGPGPCRPAGRSWPRATSSGWRRGAQSLDAMAARLQHEWQHAGEQTLAQQAQICATLEHTASAHRRRRPRPMPRSTLAEIARLVQTASEAPRAAAELVAQLRDKLSDSLARDNTLLEERSRIMATLNTLLDAVQHTLDRAARGHRPLVGSTAAWLEQAGERFTEQGRCRVGPHGSGGRAAGQQRRRGGQPGRGLRRRGRRLQPVQRPADGPPAARGRHASARPSHAATSSWPTTWPRRARSST